MCNKRTEGNAKKEGEKILQERERENRKKEMIEKGIADISKILEENLFQIQNDYRG